MNVFHGRLSTLERRKNTKMEMLAMVTHDNVVKVIDSGVLPDASLFYVMELVEGRSLEADIAKHKGRRPHWEYIREIILQICDGLAAIHPRLQELREVARDGTIYATTIYPYTLLKVESVRADKGK